jgi:hypothetical protein
MMISLAWLMINPGSVIAVTVPLISGGRHGRIVNEISTVTRLIGDVDIRRRIAGADRKSVDRRCSLRDVNDSPYRNGNQRWRADHS